MAINTQSIAYRLFHTYFIVRIPYSFANEVRQMVEGTPQFQNQQQAEVQAEEMIARQHTIPELAELSSRGCRIIIDDPMKSVDMYKLLNEYLQDWKYRTQNSINVGQVPINDLEILDNFAQVLYQISRRYTEYSITGGKTEVGLAELMVSRSFKRRSNRVKRTEPLQKKPSVVEHSSVTDDISRSTLERELRYK